MLWKSSPFVSRTQNQCPLGPQLLCQEKHSRFQEGSPHVPTHCFVRYTNSIADGWLFPPSALIREKKCSSGSWFRRFVIINASPYLDFKCLYNVFNAPLFLIIPVGHGYKFRLYFSPKEMLFIKFVICLRILFCTFN